MRSLRNVLRSPSGKGGTAHLNLILVGAFLLLAIFELTRTWFSAADISEELHATSQRGAGINRDTSELSALFHTNQITADIAGESAPLEMQAGSILSRSKSIHSHSTKILGTARDINGGVRAITAKVGQINKTAAGILGTVQPIQGRVDAIEANAASINSRFAALLPVTQLILDGPKPYGVDNIDRNVDTIIQQAHNLHSDLRNILTSAERADKHAASICDALLVDVAGGC